MAQIREFTSTNASYFILDGVKYPKSYEAVDDSTLNTDRLKVIPIGRTGEQLLFSTHYRNVSVNGSRFNSLEEAISAINEVVFSKGGGSGDGGTTGDFIPLTGTEEGKSLGEFFETSSNENGTFIGAKAKAGSISGVKIHSDGNEGVLLGNISEEDLLVLRVSAEGILTSWKYPMTYNESLVYKEYSDLQHSYSTTEAKTGGTWIDGKPIYTITKLTADPTPADMETQFPNIIVGSYTIYKYTKTTD